MGKIYQQIINTFSGGLTEEKRNKDSSKFSLTKHFDTLNFPHKIVPYYTTEAIDGGTGGGDKSYDIRDFIYAPSTSGTYRLFGHGVHTTNPTKSAIYKINPVDFTKVWDDEIPTFNVSSLARNLGTFFYYKGYIYLWGGTTSLSRFDVAESSAFEDTYKIVPTITSIAQPVHHPNDDIAYFFVNNLVYKQSVAGAFGGGDCTLALTLPYNFKITSSCAYGNYLAIGCTTTYSVDNKSVVFLWDRDSSLTTLTERIDFGVGELIHLVSLDNKLIGIINYYANSTLALSKAGKIIIKQANGQTAVVLNELNVDTTGGLLPYTQVVEDNILYVPMAAPLNGDTRNGIWAIKSDGKIVLDFVEEEVDLAASPTYQAIYKLGGVWWIAHSADGSINRTNTSKAYGNTSIYESLIFNGDDSSVPKKLLGVEVMTEKLVTSDTVVLKYRKDGDTSWTTIFTNAVASSVSHGAINIESTGANLPEFREIEFRVESTNGAIITGLKFKYEIVERNLF